MRPFTPIKSPRRVSTAGLLLVGLLSLAIASCRSPHEPTRRTDPNLDPGWPQGNRFFHQVSYQAVSAQLPTVAGAEFVNDDEICAHLPRDLCQDVRRATCTAATTANRATGRPAATWKPAARSRG